MAKDKIVSALVTKPTYINGVLHMPGEIAAANLTDLDVDSLDDDSIVGLVPHKGEELVVETPVAAVAPHAPDAPNPQGLPTGTIQSGTGRLVQVDAPYAVSDAGDEPETIEPVGADRPGVPGEQTPQKPAKPAKK